MDQSPRNPFVSLFIRRDANASLGIYRQMARPGALRPGPSLGGFFLTLGALAIHALTLVLLIGGVLLLSGSFPYICNILFGAVCIGIGLLLRPRLGKAPDDPLPRESTRALYELAEGVAQCLHVRPTTHIAVDGGYGVHWRAFGLRRETVLTIGLPLWSVLNEAERVALLAHGLARPLCADPRATFVVSSAVDALIELYALLHPGRVVPDPEHQLRRWGVLLQIGFNLIMLSAALIAYGLAWTLSSLLWGEIQRSEYQADAQAAPVAGTSAGVALLVKLRHGPRLPIVARMWRARSDRGPSFFADLCRDWLHESDNLNSVIDTDLYPGYTNGTPGYAPLYLRARLVNESPVQSAALTVTAQEMARIDQELDPLRRRLHKTIVGL